MRRRLVAAAVGVAIAAPLAVSFAQSPAAPPAPGEGQGWTGVTHPDDIIFARQALMREIEKLMRPIDAFTAGDGGDLEALKASAESMRQLFLPFPHLFPPTTNLYEPGADAVAAAAAGRPLTIAMPAVWETFAGFHALSQAAADAAAQAAVAETADAFRTAGLALRATCDGCHAAYMEPYRPTLPPTDFDPSAFGGLF